MDTRSFLRISPAAGLCLALLVGAPAYSAGPFLEEFDDGVANNWTLSSGWAVAGAPDTGLYLSGVNTTARSHAIYENNTWNTGYAYTVRMNSPTWPSANAQIGSVFNYMDSNNFYEVLFSQTTMTLWKTVGGVRSQIASKPYTGALRSNRYTDIQVVRLGSNVTIRFNGTEMLTQALNAAEVFDGRIGLATDRNTSQFDYAVVTNASAPAGPNFPRLASVRIATWDWNTVPNELARVHYVLVPYSLGWSADHQGVDIDTVIGQIKTASTVGTKVIVYTKANEANFTNQESPKTEQAVWDKINEQGLDWWVRDSQGHAVDAMFDPPKFKLVNLTRKTPVDPATGLHWSRWFAKWTVDNYYSGNSPISDNPSIDGFYMDNVNWKPPPSATDIADWDRDGVADAGTRADVHQWFRRGFRDYFDQIGSLLPPTKFKFANAATWGQTTPDDNAELAEYYGAAHGGAIEQLIAQGVTSSPEQFGGWSRAMETYRKVLSVLAGQKVAMFMHRLLNISDGAAAYYQDMRYALGSCLLDDGYYTPYDRGTLQYKSTPIFDEFNANLGQATSPPPTAPLPDGSGVWRRDFQNGIVLVNPKGNGARSNVALNGTFHKINGTQDHAVNDGSTVTQVNLADRDGIILLR